MTRPLFTYAVWATMIVVSIFLARTTAHAFVFAPHTETNPIQNLYPYIPPAQLRPLQLTIVALSIDAFVQDLGVTEGDRMAAPKNYSDVGWYGYGPAPGQEGTAVMYGHRNNGLGLSGVFKNLTSLKIEDVIEVTNQRGNVLRFRVDELSTYPYHEVPIRAIKSDPEEGARLTLITCDGNWIYDAEEGMTYDKRFVVYATLIGKPEKEVLTGRFKQRTDSSGMELAVEN